MLSFKAGFTDRDQDPVVFNALRFGTKPEAEAYAKALFWRWTAAKRWEIHESTDPVNSRFNFVTNEVEDVEVVS